ncbi:MAG: enhanced intracellular survival protein Eis [Candidatus Hodarchaeota archaeon]
MVYNITGNISRIKIRKKMEIRKLTEENREAYGKLARYAFQTSKNTYDNLEWPIKSRPMDQFYGVFENDLLIAGCGLIPYEIKFRSITFKMGGVDGVATKPEYRNRGIVREILKKLFHDMYENQIPISVLFPFKIAFYEKLGYKNVDEKIFYQFKISDIKYKETNYQMKEDERINEDIIQVYNEVIENYDYIAKRAEMQWKRLYKENYKFICFNGDRPLGYVILHFPKKSTEWIFTQNIELPEKTIFVIEAFWLNHTAKQTIINFLWTHRDQREYIAGYFPVNENIIDLLITSRILERKIVGNSLLRIINVETVLKNLKYPLNTFSILFHIYDKFCPWNNGFFNLTSKDEIVNVEFKETSEESADIEIDISYLAQLLAGFRTVKDLLEFGFISINHEKFQVLQNLFPKTKNYFNDFF